MSGEDGPGLRNSKPRSRSRLGRFEKSKKACMVGAEGAERRRTVMRSVRRWGWDSP